MGERSLPPPRIPVKFMDGQKELQKLMKQDNSSKAGLVRCEYCDRQWSYKDSLSCPGCGAPMTQPLPMERRAACPVRHPRTK